MTRDPETVQLSSQLLYFVFCAQNLDQLDSWKTVVFITWPLASSLSLSPWYLSLSPVAQQKWDKTDSGSAKELILWLNDQESATVRQMVDGGRFKCLTAWCQQCWRRLCWNFRNFWELDWAYTTQNCEGSDSQTCLVWVVNDTIKKFPIMARQLSPHSVWKLTTRK